MPCLGSPLQAAKIRAVASGRDGAIPGCQVWAERARKGLSPPPPNWPHGFQNTNRDKSWQCKAGCPVGEAEVSSGCQCHIPSTCTHVSIPAHTAYPLIHVLTAHTHCGQAGTVRPNVGSIHWTTVEWGPNCPPKHLGTLGSLEAPLLFMLVLNSRSPGPQRCSV